MRPVLGVFLALLVVLAGCTAPLGAGDGTTSAPTPDDGAQDAPPTAEDDTDETDDGSQDGTSTDVEAASTTTTTTAGDGSDGTTTTADGAAAFPADPASDPLGWEAGIWYNESIRVNNSDGMNGTERTLAVARAMARIERVRETEFPGNRTVPVDVRSRAAFARNQTSGNNYSEAFRTFDNVKFEALLFVDDSEDSIEVQNQNRGASVAGYYSSAADSMVLITESDQPKFDGESTLAHELVHALQDRKFNLSSVSGDGTRDGYAGYTGLVEGDAKYVELNYMDRCGNGWSCIDPPSGSGDGGGSPDLHFGIYFMQFFPYSDGPTFIAHHKARGGWDRIDAMYDDPPASAEQILYPRKYGSDAPAEIELTDETSGSWERVRPDPQRAGTQRPDYARLGVGSLASMFIYTAYDRSNSSALVSPLGFLNMAGGSINRTDPINYGFDFLEGWAGDRLHAYRNTATGETGYVWRLRWDSASQAEAFARNYRALLSYWGGSPTGPSTVTIPEGQRFDGGYHVGVSGDTVTIVHAPTTDQLGDVYGPAGS